MKKLLQQASRSALASISPITASTRALPVSAPPICLRCQYRTAATPLHHARRASVSSEVNRSWARRKFSASSRWMDARDPLGSKPISMPPPASQPATPRQGRVEDTAPEVVASLEGQERLQEEPDTLIEKEYDVKKPSKPTETAPDNLPTLESQERLQEPHNPSPASSTVHDTVTRVPDEHLPSHREKQRWDLSRRLSEAMDNLLPKLAVVTQKVNTYTGTDYSGVEALRREIKEQEELVKARRAAIETAKHTLDEATSRQASAQKEVVALLERKHSWREGDLERYMSLIRSEHVNDQAVREAKEAVFTAENALEEARTRLEKRERAQYHEEQIWSDTIRRNSTWVTFGLMGVNIFLLLLSLVVLEPWRRRRMVREIKNALEAQKVSMEVPVAPAVPRQNDTAAIEAEIDRVIDSEVSSTEGIVPEPTPVEAVRIAERAPVVSVTGSPSTQDTPLQVPSDENTLHLPSTWHGKVTAIAHDIVSDRIISMRRVDYTTAILQGAAAGAVITAAVIGMLRPA